MDRKRQKWTRFLYGVEWEDSSLYDMVLNLERTSIDGACQTVAQMADLPEFGVTAASLKAQEDLLLGGRVWIALAKDERTEAAFVSIVAQEGKVAIRGNAGSGKVIDAIPLVASQVQGVKEVVSEVGVGSDWYW